MSESSTPEKSTRWKIHNLSTPLTEQYWEVKVDGEWRRDVARKFPEMDDAALIKMWFKVLCYESYEGKRSVSTIAKYFGTTIRNVKTKRAFINNRNQAQGGTHAELLPELTDWTDYEQDRIDAHQKEKTPQQLFDSLPPTLRKLALAKLQS
jgi:hypothetical protein